MEQQHQDELAHYVAKATHAERRDNTRYTCEGKAEVRREGLPSVLWGIVTDLSYGGCYIESPSPLPVGSRIILTLTILDVTLEVKGTVAAVHPMVGMGIMFLSCSAQTNETLERMLSNLASVPLPAQPLPISDLESSTALGEIDLLRKFKPSAEVARSVLEQIIIHMSRSAVLTRRDLLEILEEVR
ncbi:MAG: PilZ domain-containing protein [Terriglobales bacterium]|jgi:hypothetical protein